ncbi:MAG: hypothetical protein AAFQ75_11430, partial [Pseudomonadota bacterium]
GREMPGSHMVSATPAEPGVVPRHIVPAEARPSFVMPVSALRLPAESCGLGHLDRSVAEVSSRIDTFEMPPLQLKSKRDALVLVPTEPCPAYSRLLDALDARIGRCCAAHAAITQLCPTRCALEMPLSRPLKPGLAEQLAEELAPALDPYLAERPQVHALTLIAAAHWRSEVTLIEHYPLDTARSTRLPENFAVFGPDLYSDFGDHLAAPPEDFFED